MRSSARIMVSLLVVATIYWVLTNGGGGLLTRTLETTRGVVAMWNLQTVRETILATRVLQEPETVADWTDEDFSDFVREFVVTKSGGSDPAMDPWAMPFLLTELEDSKDWIVFSTGPDRTPDHCDFEGPGGDDVCLLIDASEIGR